MANVKITSKHSGPILVKIPDLNFRREWMNRGSSVMVDSEKLEEMMYDPGFRYMIESEKAYTLRNMRAAIPRTYRRQDQHPHLLCKIAKLKIEVLKINL